MPDPLTVKSFQKLIYDRYYKTDAARGGPATFLWFIEEVGELATAIQQCSGAAPGGAGAARQDPSPEDRRNLEEEFADVIAWLTTLANITGVDLESALGKYTDPGRVEGVKG